MKWWSVLILVLVVVAVLGVVRLMSGTEPVENVAAATPRELQAGAAAHVSLPTLAGPSAVQVASPPSSRDWVPDGRIWVRVIDAQGRPIQAIITSVPMAARCFRPKQEGAIGPEAWQLLQPDVSRPSVAISASGFSVAWLHAPDTSQRHTVVLVSAPRGVLSIIDQDSLRAVAQAHVVVSRAPLPSAIEEPGWLPGPDPATAMFGAISEDSGRAILDVADIQGPWHWDAIHPLYVASPRMTETIAALSDYPPVLMAMPWVGAVRFSGDRLVSGSVRAAHAPVARNRTRQRLEEIREQLRTRWENSLSVAFVDIGSAAREVSATAMLERVGVSTVTVQTIPLADFREPQVHEVSPSVPSAPLATIVVREPPGADAVGEALPLIVTGPNGFVQRTAFGASFQAPAGRYRVAGGGVGGATALAPCAFDVAAGEQREVITEWRATSWRYEIAVESGDGSGFERVVFFYQGADGKDYGVEMRPNGRTKCMFWLRESVDRVRVAVPWHDPVEVKLDQVIGAQRKTGSVIIRAAKTK